MHGRLSTSTVGRAARVAAALALLGFVAGCDRCGDWWWASPQSQACKGRLPAQP